MNDVNVVLAERSGVGKIDLCECASIHLHVGPVTIHMVPEMFAQMAILVREAMESLSVIAAAGLIDPTSTVIPNARDRSSS